MYLNRLIIGVLLFSFYTCKEEKSAPANYHVLYGKAMGSTYTIKYKGDILRAKEKVDSLLNDFNSSLSTYDSSSTISRVNQCEKKYCYSLKEDRFFEYSLEKALNYATVSKGAFDPTIMPVVNYYGFGYEKKDKPTEVTKKAIDSLKALVGTDKIKMYRTPANDSVCVEKANKHIKIDLNASAPGHGVDEVALFFESFGVRDYMVEIGGEVRTAGLNATGKPWTIGINRPVSGSKSEDVIMPVAISNKSLATSGNYRNFYENGSIKLAHIIDPRTCNARPSDILSATLITDACIDADAYATTCMVLGLKQAIAFVESDTSLAAFFIYKSADADTLQYYFSPGFSNHLIAK